MDDVQKKLTLLVILCFGLTSCSVYRASSNSGVSVYDTKNCKARTSLLSHGMQPIESREPDGKVTEIFRAEARKSGVNYVRAFEHGWMFVH